MFFIGFTGPLWNSDPELQEGLSQTWLPTMLLDLIPLPAEHGTLGAMGHHSIAVGLYQRQSCIFFLMDYKWFFFLVTFPNAFRSEDILKGDICDPHFRKSKFENGELQNIRLFPVIKLREAKSWNPGASIRGEHVSQEDISNSSDNLLEYLAGETGTEIMMDLW